MDSKSPSHASYDTGSPSLALCVPCDNVLRNKRALDPVLAVTALHCAALPSSHTREKSRKQDPNA
jgi:hypothetical protein